MIKQGIQFLDQIKSINSTVLPIGYSDLFYKSIAKKDSIILVIQKEEKNIGGILGWKEKDTFILGTLAVYTKYQGNGYGKQLIECFISKVKELNQSNDDENKTIKRIEVQIHIENKNAIEFYQHFGFKEIKIVPKAYPRLKNPKALVYSLCL